MEAKNSQQSPLEEGKRSARESILRHNGRDKLELHGHCMHCQTPAGGAKWCILQPYQQAHCSMGSGDPRGHGSILQPWLPYEAAWEKLKVSIM